jgi:transposase InsO family protein
LRLQGVIDGKTPSSSTIYRYLRLRNKAEKAALDATEKRAFEAPYSNNLWQTDIMYLNHLIPTRGKDGKHRKKQAYLVAIIDDHSRLLCHGEFYFSQNLLAYLDCLKKAVQKRGCFERIYCDNGQVFLSSQVKRIAAKMGSMVLHCKPNQASSKGKIEKFFRSVREQFLDECYATDFPKTLEELNKRFSKWCEETYNVRNHSGIGNAPVKKWMETSHKIKLMPPLKIDEAFTFEAERRVKSDGTFSLDGKTFETYGALAGKKVLVSYDPFFPETAHVSHDGKNFGKANLLDKKFNASKPRKKLTEGN